MSNLGAHIDNLMSNIVNHIEYIVNLSVDYAMNRVSLRDRTKITSRVVEATPGSVLDGGTC